MDKRYRQVLLVIISIWLVFLIDSFPFIELKGWGIVPREVAGLRGVLLAPLLHGNMSHILGNTFPLLGLLLVLSLLYVHFFWVVVLGSTLIGGSLVWLFGSKNIHIGASGLVFALAGFLLFRTFRENKIIFLVVAFLMFLFYGNLWVGLIPFFAYQDNISYSSHWYGFISGIILAFLLKKKIPQEPTEDQ